MSIVSIMSPGQQSTRDPGHTSCSFPRAAGPSCRRTQAPPRPSLPWPCRDLQRRLPGGLAGQALSGWVWSWLRSRAGCFWRRFAAKFAGCRRSCAPPLSKAARGLLRRRSVSGLASLRKFAGNHFRRSYCRHFHGGLVIGSRQSRCAFLIRRSYPRGLRFTVKTHDGAADVQYTADNRLRNHLTFPVLH